MQKYIIHNITNKYIDGRHFISLSKTIEVMFMVYYGHSKDGQPEQNYQTLKEHLINTANLSRSFAEPFGSGELAWIEGIMHDIGKYSAEFQRKLKGERLFVDHSTAGAQLAVEHYGDAVGRLLSYCIAGHHAGLPDYGTLNKGGSLSFRLKADIPYYKNYRTDIDLPEFKSKLPIKIINKDFTCFSISFYIRMLYSCLVDADYLDTESFMENGNVNRNIGEDMGKLYKKLMEHLKGFDNKEGWLNKKRHEILERCLTMADSPRGIYSLTVPTGGGKTLSSLSFALKHSIINNMNRIIYVIPYTSIIEQNAEVFRKILGKENVLEHHSSYNYREDANDDADLFTRLKYAEENWDIPVVVTTNVQFYESLFSNKSSKCRKLHNIANSVIILDEAQMTPTQYLRPCLMALSELVANYCCTVMLCTATQPALNEVMDNLDIKEIIKCPGQLFEDLKRVNIMRKGSMDDAALSSELMSHNRVLCIVNTRKHARELYKKIAAFDGAYHLSTLMCPMHRRKILAEIKQRLSDKEICRVVSTQLIEAGVDIDFPVVYRSSAGLDSIAQSAGRCNREGSPEMGSVYVFTSTEKYSRALGWLSRTISAGESAMRRYDDLLCPDAISFYFRQLYDMERGSRFDNRKVLECFNERGSELKFEFAEASARFKLIDDNTYPIVIPYDKDAERLINDVRYSYGSISTMRKIQQYTVSVYENEYNKLLGVGALEDVNGVFMVLRDKASRYDEKHGLIIPEGGEALFS